MTEFANRVLSLAATQIGVREHGRNRGPEIDSYNRDIGHDPTKADPWCSTFVCAMVKRASDEAGIKPPLHLTAGVFTLDEQAPRQCRRSNPVPGSIFIKAGHKHTGLVESVDGDTLTTIEGNTDPGGSSDGDGVYRRIRKRTEIIAYLDLSEMPIESLPTGAG